MNRQEMISVLASKTGKPKSECEQSINTVIATIAEALERGEDVALPGFGTFTISERAARQGRNPKTGETIEIAASRVPTFKAGSKLKSAVNPSK
jgi:DNA-binding protein HU-beta